MTSNVTAAAVALAPVVLPLAVFAALVIARSRRWHLARCSCGWTSACYRTTLDALAEHRAHEVAVHPWPARCTATTITLPGSTR